ncbi:MAG: rod shape-determining protein MreC [Coriobacteriia bacterium]|nr:rod shape-determining protein MreC [Coriobacteriia bacterium]
MRVQRTETRGPRIRWVVLYVALAIVIMTVWFREGDTGPLHRLRSVVQAGTAPVSATGEWVTRPIRGLIAWGSDLGVSRSQLEELRLQNQRLRVTVAELEEARLENERLRGLVKVARAGDVEAMGAHVIGRPANSWDGIITIDRGADDGITPGMPVVGAFGLLGQTVEVAKTSAKVRLITDQRSGVAGMIQRSRVEGVVKGSLDGRLTFDFVSVDTTVTPGDVVMTSGLGGVFPKGVVIGEVLEVERNPGALQQLIRVTPGGDPSGLEEVLVLIGDPPASDPTGGE